MSKRGIVFGLVATVFVTCAFPLVASLGGKTPPIPWLFVSSVVVATSSFVFAARFAPNRSAITNAISMFVIVAVGTALLFPVFVSSRDLTIRTVCLSGAKQRAAATLLYAADFDDRYPPAETWATVIDKYLTGKPSHCLEAKTPFSYAYNTSVSHIRTTAVADLFASVLLFESDALVPNAHGGREAFKKRHDERGSIAFMDGHVGAKRDAPQDNLAWNPK